MSDEKRILIIDDERPIVTAYKDHFTRQGYSVETAHTGKEGIAKLAGFMPHVILLDIRMPEFDGIQTLEEIKKDNATKNIPVIMLTNLGDEENLLKAARLGGTLYFIKVDMSLAVLDEWISELIKLKESKETS